MAKKGTRKCGDCKKYYPEDNVCYYMGGVSHQFFTICRKCEAKRKEIK